MSTTRCLQACSAEYWIAGRIVSLRLRPGSVGLSVSVPSGIGCPLEVICIASAPARPASRELYCSSTPDSPTMLPAWPASVKPIRLAARSPSGYSVL